MQAVARSLSQILLAILIAGAAKGSDSIASIPWPETTAGTAAPAIPSPSSVAGMERQPSAPDPVETLTTIQTLEPAAPLPDLSSKLAAEPPRGGFQWKTSSFQVVPYGAFWADMIYATERTSPGAFTLFVFSPEDQGESAFEIDARRTRFGLNVSGPKLGTAETGGRVEIDFQGNFVTENRAGVLLRHAYWEAKDDRTRILVGQNWDVASPLNPNTINYGTGWLAGNIGFRRAQFRAERFIAWSDRCLITLQGSLNQDVVPDFLTEPGIRREPSDWPVVEGRVAVSFGRQRAGADKTTIGLSGHIGETGFDFLTPGPPPLSLPVEDDARFRTWSINLDLYAPFNDQVGFQGEFFTGANLSNFLGGVGQGVCPCLRQPIRSTGGWGEFWYEMSACQEFHLGGGIDDPHDEDLLLGRSSNLFLFVNTIRHITPALSTGLEITYWKTNYRETRQGQIPDDQLAPSEAGQSVTFDWMMKYEF